MTLNKLFQFFVPKDKKFFPLFEQASTNLILLAETLHEVVNAQRGEREDSFNKIDELEEIIEDITYQTNIELSKNFITPYDREDIHRLVTAIDDIIDWLVLYPIANADMEDIKTGETPFFLAIKLKLSP